ncbi:hypothetical protein HK102_008582 [Quaeritorhiza haematococci]|nr:hypothetical protein HK102_008582 [Quaeritorhiza haematococci]
MTVLICSNKGCGKTFADENNHDTSCEYHPGAPVFHEGLKIPGCSVGPHKYSPPEPQPASKAPEPVEIKPTANVNGVEVYGTPAPPATPAPSTPSKSTEPPKEEKPTPEDELNDPADAVVSVGTKCKRPSCSAEYTGESSKDEECIFHAGQPVFHEGSKGWSCCSRKVLEFDEFLKIKGCMQGKHRFLDVEKPAEETVHCRHDWYQTPKSVIISFFAKKTDKERTKVEFDTEELKVLITFLDGKVFKFKTKLSQPIIPSESTFVVLSTKVEVSLKKANGISWPSIEPKANVTSWTTFGTTAIDRWFEEINHYERTLEQMAKAKLDDNFREELKAIEQWFSVLSDPERTTALYSLLQHTNQVQIRFFITVLQQMAQKDPTNAANAANAAAGATPAAKPSGAAITGGPVTSPAPIGTKVPSELEVQQEVNEEAILGMLPVAPGAAIRNNSRRLYDRHSAPTADEKYSHLLGDVSTSECKVVLEAPSPPRTGIHEENSDVLDEFSYKRASGELSARTSLHSPLLRPRTPVDEAIANANWSLNLTPSGSTTPTIPIIGSIGERTSSLAKREGPGLGNGAFPPLATTRGSSLDSEVYTPDISGSTLAPPSAHSGGLAPPRSPYSRSTSPRPVSPIIVTPSSPVQSNGQQGGHPGTGWNHIGVGLMKPPGSPGYAHSDYSDYDESAYLSDVGTENTDGGNQGRGPHKDKGKIPESIDLEALKDIPSWLRSLRLHKYTSLFENMDWKTMIKLTDADLTAKGVAALGARRKMLKVFELVKKELDAKGVSYS